MKCSSCGAILKGNAKYCMDCGSEISYKEPERHFSRPPEKYTGPRKLYRSRSDRMVAGVCGGLGEYFEMDSNIIRILFVLFLLAGGSGLLAYLIMIVLIPESPLDPWAE